MINYTKAVFWKCALQVNPFDYIAYRGEKHGLDEDQYNRSLVNIAVDNGIKVIGLADHGNVGGVNKIRSAMNEHGITVFPGFEIASSEKAHFVCLYHEETTVENLNRFLGDLQQLKPADATIPSKLSAGQLIEKVVKEQGGFVYAAHCTTNNGILANKLSHIWKNPLLRAVQIPGPIVDLKGISDGFYYRVIKNKEAAYKRDDPVGVINSSDVARPEDLKDPQSYCLIKMTKPNFDAFKLAFFDPESRVRLNSDISAKFYSQLEKIKIIGGFLDGLEIEFSEHLNAIIGGRGTGKSTLLECIRYVLDHRPIGKNSQKQHDEIIKENLGKSKARVELSIYSSKMNGQRFTIVRRYGEYSSVFDAQGHLSNFRPFDLLPEIEIFGQNEIYEIAQDRSGQRKLMKRFLSEEHAKTELNIKEAMVKLADNRKNVLKAREELAEIQDKVAQLPKLEEQLGQFKQFGLEDKLAILPLLEKSRSLLLRAEGQEALGLEKAVLAIRDFLPDTTFLSAAVVESLPQAVFFQNIRGELESLRNNTEKLITRWQDIFTHHMEKIAKYAEQIRLGIDTIENDLEETFAKLPACEGKSGKEIGIEYQNLLRKIESIRPLKVIEKNSKNLLNELLKQRKLFQNDLSFFRSILSADFEQTVKRLNKRLHGQLKLTVKIESNHSPVIEFLLRCGLEGVAEKRLAWIEQAQDFSPVKLANAIWRGSDELRRIWSVIPPMVAEALTRLTFEQRLLLEEIELPDDIDIELNVDHDGADKYRPLNKLSTGQQCTAILHLLLLENKDPLLMDQPEDNLDNAFIADRIVAELRRAKIERQFLFATHNANIPVFGDAEWIGIFEAENDQGIMSTSSQGSIDVHYVRDKAATILEGGKTAFNQRKLKYGF